MTGHRSMLVCMLPFGLDRVIYPIDNDDIALHEHQYPPKSDGTQLKVYSREMTGHRSMLICKGDWVCGQDVAIKTMAIHDYSLQVYVYIHMCIYIHT
jgi:hypothetical protein